MEFRKLAHSVLIDPVAVLDFTLVIFVTFPLILRLFVILLIVATLVEQRRIAVVQNMLRVRPDLFQGIQKFTGSFVLKSITVIE
jgi:hypothetical protein